MTDEIGVDPDRVRVYPADRERINDLRRGDDTQADVIRRLLEGEIDGGDDRQLGEERIQELINELAAVAGDARVDDDAIAREVVRSLDYAELATTVADELEGRMR